MTKLERELILQAAEDIDSGESNYSCTSIVHANIWPWFEKVTDKECNELAKMYQEFYGMTQLIWFSDEFSDEELREIRVFMLLLFAEAG